MLAALSLPLPTIIVTLSQIETIENRNKAEYNEYLFEFSPDQGRGVAAGQMDGSANGQLGLGPGRGYLELGGPCEGRLGGAAPSPQGLPR